MTISGKLLIAGEWQEGDAGSFQAVNPATGQPIATQHTKASEQQVSVAAELAGEAFAGYRNTSLKARATFLHACADHIMQLGDELLDCMQQETGYPRGRCEGERARTVGQLRMQADYIVSGDYLDPRIDSALPQRQPIPRPDLRYLNQAIGVVAVFAVSNFPLAYSSAGGDTASALAAGCPVIVKGHPSHPGTGELVVQALQRAARECDMPTGVISYIQGDDNIAGAALINAPQVKAIGFTGSIKGGTSIAKMAAVRPEPIPVFAEMGSINPVVLLPHALAESATDIAAGFVGALTLGTGQFCVNPGLIVALKSPHLDTFVEAVSAQLNGAGAGVMLNQRICQNYQQGVEQFTQYSGVAVAANGEPVAQTEGFYAQTALFRTQASYFLANPQLHEEVFGPASLLVECETVAQIQQVLLSLPGQLTGTVHGAKDELEEHSALLDLLSVKVGRMVINGFPTGVEVCPAMVHGGPFPASTDSRFTAVGTAAIHRWIRPVCYQNFPQTLLPEALKDANPLGLLRTVNGIKTLDPIV
ncbi:aldehyde dehydrogenase (NADP(+)) [Neptunicella sp. SCSIO 80796]|uniref:aldehyde dehydrogenase (NADP(+)) n=1 Tax=Neptunicella plasticusilytica TaxID=3117012 RepID=UPI003A4E541F